MRFFCDDHLRRLARWLRAAGYDTAWEPSIPDDELVRRCRREARVLLTLDRRLARRPGLQASLLPSHDPLEQLRYVRDRFDLDLFERAFTRCPLCNALLEEVPEEELEVPERVRSCCARFWRCTGCGQPYWEGDHVRHMRDRFRLVQEA